MRNAVEPGLPVVGQVAAGSPLLAEENVTRHCRVDPALFQPRADYLLRVSGLSMRDAGIGGRQDRVRAWKGANANGANGVRPSWH